MEKRTGLTITIRMFVVFGLYVLLFACLPLIIYGRSDWWQAWVFAAMTILSALISRLLVARKNPDLLAERGRYASVPEAKDWDKKLSPLVGLVGPLLSLVVCGLDRRYGWSPLIPLWLMLAALLALFGAHVLAGWSLVVNRFFSGMARIQAERGQVVVDSGPYRIVRHPGYAGGGLAFLATPVLLGSLWGLIPALGTLALIVVRTSLEDRMLQDELPGYRGYAARTRYRLIPGIW